MPITLRDDIPTYMAETRRWLEETRDVPLEAMDAFFTARIDGYEEHMSPWRDAYRRMAELLPAGCRTLLDIGCGTGLELDDIFRRFPRLAVTGVDLCGTMLEKLREKHGDRALELLCADYFEADLGEEAFDAAISFETLHHFTAARKTALFQKLYRALRPGGVYIECDYIACCPEEEEMLFAECRRRRERDGIPAGRFVHFDTPLTLGHETACLQSAGFADIRAVESINGATFIVSRKG